MQFKLSKPSAAAQEIQTLIRSGQMKQGTRLPSQKDLAKDLNVSRATLREALVLLENIGFITIEPGNGTFVCRKLPSASNEQVPWRDPIKFSPHSVFQARILIEGELAALLAQSIGPDVLRELGALTDEMHETWANQQVIAHVEADVAFHRTIARNCPNRFLAELYLNHASQFVETQRQPVLRADDIEMQRSIAGHRSIIAALQSGDGAAARKAMRAHILHTAISAGQSESGFPEF